MRPGEATKGARVGDSLEKAGGAADFERLRIVSVMDCLCEQTPFNKLTVTDICQQAQISRTSFYRLFQDKCDAANWYVNTVSRIGHVQCGRTLSWHDASITTLSGLALMRNLLMSTKTYTGFDSSENTGTRLRIASLTETVRTWHHVEPDFELSFQIAFFARAEIPLVRDWYQNVNHVSVEEMARAVEGCVPQRLHDLLALPDDPTRTHPLTYGRLVTML